MPRLIEIALFLAPFAAFVLWRLLAPSLALPAWLVALVAAFLALTIAGLLWIWRQDAGDARQTYVPATLQHDRIIAGHGARPP